jgi:hypothetical protein
VLSGTSVRHVRSGVRQVNPGEGARTSISNLKKDEQLGSPATVKGGVGCTGAEFARFLLANWIQERRKKGLGTGKDLWYYFVAFDALVSPLER